LPLLFRLQANYGCSDPECVAKVKEIYQELQLPKIYSDYKESNYESLMSMIEECSGTIPRELFIAYVRKVYKSQHGRF